MFWPIFRRVLLTFPLAVQTATNSELPTRQKEGGGGAGGAVRARVATIERQRRQTNTKDVRSARGWVNIYFFKWAWWRDVVEERPRSCAPMDAYKMASLYFPCNQFCFTFYPDKRRKRWHLGYSRLSMWKGVQFPLNRWFNTVPQQCNRKRNERINHQNGIQRAKCKRIRHMERSLELGHRKYWHSAAEEMWLKHNSPAKPSVCERFINERK